jgi:NADH-quinone oxidoreductase subunit L
MSFYVAHPWLAVVVPLVLAVLLAAGRRTSSAAGPLVALVGPLMTVALGLASLNAISSTASVSGGIWNTSRLAAAAGEFVWFRVGDSVFTIAWAVDSLTAVMLLVVGVVAACVVIFSVGYMAGDEGWMRYFASLSLFTGSMNLLVIASSFTALFIGWELVGVCSFLLIGFWYQKPSAAGAAMKAFLTTRVGDVGLLIGIAILWTATDAETYEGVLGALGGVEPGIVTAAALCLAVGAMGKSAQFPLHGWLPDAMEGPTPVSALIHAATMVAAGVFLVARVWPLYEAAPRAQLLLLTVGAVSAFGAALVAVAQRDIKKVLAYSTISQLGFMFAALGSGAWVAAFFHLVAHAAFKALLFLCSGSVIHGAGTQDLHGMGGLRKPMPVTFVAWIVGSLALAGIFPLAGFFSKDAILEAVWHTAPGVGVLLFGASALTALYITRATRLAFFGESTPGLHGHESPPSMLVPLVLLAGPAVLLGAAAPAFSTLMGHEPESLNIGVSLVAVGLAVVGAVVGWLSSAGPRGDIQTAHRLGRVHPVLASAYGWDGLVQKAVVGPVVGISRTLWAVGDRLVADGVVEGSARMARGLGRLLSRLQTGNAQTYSAAIVVGFVLMLVASVWLGR